MSASHVKQPIILVDATSYLFRAYHAMSRQNLSAEDGFPTGTIYGVVNMLKSLINEYQPTHLAMVFDDKGKTFRHEQFEEYKANRPPMPDDLRMQIEPLHAIIRAMGVPLIIEPGVEADDVIGTLATRFAKEGHHVLVSTGDKDMAQLVSERIHLLNTMTGERLTPETVPEKFGVRPEQIVDYLALLGDTSDNVPGVPKVGKKTAAKWLQQYGDLDNLTAHADEIKGKVGESLRAHLDQLALSRKLVTIVCDLPLPETLDDLALQPPDNKTLAEYYRRFGFRRWLKEALQNEEGAETKPTTSRVDRMAYFCIQDEAELQTWCDSASKNGWLVFDTETTSQNPMVAKLVGIAIATAPGKAAYIPMRHVTTDTQLPTEVVWRHLRPLLEDPSVIKIGQNLKYDLEVLAREEINVNGIIEDTMLESYVLDPAAGRHDLDSLSLRHLNHACLSFEDVAGKGKQQKTFDHVDLKLATEYAAEDADVTLRLHELFQQKLADTEALAHVYESIERPLIRVLADMEQNGVLVDANMLKQQSQEIAKRLKALEEEAYALAGEKFNLASPKQLQSILFEKLGLPVKKKTPKGQPSTAEEVLAELALDYPLPKLILEHRSLAKLKNTYLDKLPTQILPETGRVHTSYHQAVTSTGRLSSSDPNLQNIPVRTEEGRRIRQAFIAPEGHCLIAADYSQIELRIMAHLSGDEGLQRAFEQGLDIHAATASEVFGVPLMSVTPEQRRRAKAINFGLIYGMSAFGLAKQLGIERDEAQHYIHTYFARYPGVEAYMNRIRQTAAEKGYVETLFGRRLPLPDIHSKNGRLRQAAERAAINAPMQGTAADIIKRSMIDIHGWLKAAQLPVKMLMQVHDELVFEVPESLAKEIASEVRTRMSGAAALRVPLVVDVGIGRNWDEAH